ncbi:MAG: hypothetical protein WBC44_13145 [Planctomycetaceae bacterium]
MPKIAERKPRAIAVDLKCRNEAVTLTLRHGERAAGFQPMGKSWRTLRRGDTVRGPGGYDYTVERLTLREAEPPLEAPVEIESVAAWVATGLRR